MVRRRDSSRIRKNQPDAFAFHASHGAMNGSRNSSRRVGLTGALLGLTVLAALFGGVVLLAGKDADDNSTRARTAGDAALG